MKIGFFLQSYSLGGVDTFLVNLINNFKINSKIILFYNNNHPNIKNIKKKLTRKVKFVKYGILSLENIFFFKNLKSLNLLIKFFLIIIFPLFSYYQYKKLSKLSSAQKLDRFMVINGGYPGGDLCRIASIAWFKINSKIKSWHNFHNIAVKKDKFFLNNFYRNKVDEILKSSINGFITVSKSCKASLQKRRYLKNIKILTIYNGYKKIKFKKKDIRKELNLDTKAKLLLLLGEYDLRKGHELILKVMKELVKVDNNIYLLICGYGSQNQINIISQLVKDLNLEKNIFLKNFRADNLNLISQCNILVIPSLRFESFGYTAVEAMSLKKPVIASNIGGLKEIIKNNKNGFLIRLNDHKLFRRKIMYLLKNPKKSKIMGVNGFRRYKNYYTSKKMAKKYSNIILN